MEISPPNDLIIEFGLLYDLVFAQLYIALWLIVLSNMTKTNEKEENTIANDLSKTDKN